jgi:hypothetical protein
LLCPLSICYRCLLFLLFVDLWPHSFSQLSKKYDLPGGEDSSFEHTEYPGHLSRDSFDYI